MQLMAADDIPTPRPLPNKPLVEAIFELRWALKEPGPAGTAVDPGFRVALGRYYDKVRTEYPVMIDLPTSQVPEDMTAYSVRHQFRSKADGWPLTQIGPGILTVNETNGYSWDAFRPKLLSAIDGIFTAYPTDLWPFSPVGAQLRYINAIRLPSGQSPTSILAEALHTKVEVDPRLFGAAVPTPDSDLNLILSYPLTEPLGTGHLRFTNAKQNGEPVMVFEIGIRSDQANAPKLCGAYEEWLHKAHAVAERWFLTLCRGELLASFEEIK